MSNQQSIVPGTMQQSSPVLSPSSRPIRGRGSILTPDSTRRPPSTDLTPSSRAKRGRGADDGVNIRSLHVTPPSQQPPVSGRSPFSMQSPTLRMDIPQSPISSRRPVRRVIDVGPTQAQEAYALGDGNCLYRFINCLIKFYCLFLVRLLWQEEVLEPLMIILLITFCDC
jgi:hypothetical protein